MILLAIDTSANLCAACVWNADAGQELGRCVRDIGKGHAEQLMAVIDEALGAAGITYGDLGGVAVAVGPGSFTGIRVGVSTARGLALALKIPSTGVTTLEALAEDARQAFPGRPVMAAIDAKRGEFYACVVDAEGRTILAPAAMTPERAVELLGGVDAPVLAGTAAPILAANSGRDSDLASTQATADIAAYARLAARNGFESEKPRPLYLREADAKPQEGFVLPRRDA